MVEISVDIKDKIMNYINLLKENGFPIKEAFLFGSYAHGKQDEWSDIDLAIVSDKFEGNRFLDKEKIRTLQRQIDNRISPFPLSNEDLIDDWFVKSEILQKGIRIF